MLTGFGPLALQEAGRLATQESRFMMRMEAGRVTTQESRLMLRMEAGRPIGNET